MSPKSSLNPCWAYGEMVKSSAPNTTSPNSPRKSAAVGSCTSSAPTVNPVGIRFFKLLRKLSSNPTSDAATGLSAPVAADASPGILPRSVNIFRMAVPCGPMACNAAANPPVALVAAPGIAWRLFSTGAKSGTSTSPSAVLASGASRAIFCRLATMSPVDPRNDPMLLKSVGVVNPWMSATLPAISDTFCPNPEPGRNAAGGTKLPISRTLLNRLSGSDNPLKLVPASVIPVRNGPSSESAAWPPNRETPLPPKIESNAVPPPLKAPYSNALMMLILTPPSGCSPANPGGGSWPGATLAVKLPISLSDGINVLLYQSTPPGVWRTRFRKSVWDVIPVISKPGPRPVATRLASAVLGIVPYMLLGKNVLARSNAGKNAAWSKTLLAGG